MTFRTRDLVTAGLLVLWLPLGVVCYPDPQPDPPRCTEEDVTIDAPLGSVDCSTGRFWTRMAFAVQRSTPAEGVDLELARGYVIRRHPGSDGGTFYSAFWRKDIAGQTDPQRRTIEVASFVFGIPHELNHAGDDAGCADLPDGGAACHQRWAERGICENLRRAGQPESCSAP